MSKKRSLTSWMLLGARSVLATLGLSMATSLVCVLRNQDFYFFQFPFYKLNAGEQTAKIMNFWEYHYLSWGWIGPFVLLLLGTLATGAGAWLLWKEDQIEKENTKHRLALSKNTRKTQRHREEEEALFV